MNKIKITEKQKRKEKGKVYGSTPFYLNVKTNVGKLFFKILRKNFPKTLTKTQLKLVIVILEI